MLCYISFEVLVQSHQEYGTIVLATTEAATVQKAPGTWALAEASRTTELQQSPSTSIGDTWVRNVLIGTAPVRLKYIPQRYMDAWRLSMAKWPQACVEWLHRMLGDAQSC